MTNMQQAQAIFESGAYSCVLYRDGEYTTIDLERAIRNAETSARRIISEL